MSELTRRTLLQGSAIAAGSAFDLTTAVAGVPGGTANRPSLRARERLLLDFGWRFHLGHACDPEKDFGFGRTLETYAKSGLNVADAAALDFDDSAWRLLDLPHDWAVELPITPSVNPAEDDPRAAHGFRPLGRQFPETSVGWYRRRFELHTSDRGKKLSLEFDGVFRNAIVIVNGFVVGRNESGYAPFRVDISDYANFGGPNVVTVRVDATLGEGWFYEGAGIYRHVWLVKTDPLHVPQWGIAVSSALRGNVAEIGVTTELVNDGDTAAKAQIVSTILDPQGHAVARVATAQVRLAAQETHTITQTVTLNVPALWSPDTPHLYALVTEVMIDGRPVDDCITPFGIRSVHFDSEKGFFLNGRPLKLKGTCNHQDFAGIGTALPDAIHALRVDAVKAMGSNAWRSAHNPPAQEFLDACDRLGLLVIDETRRMASDEEGLSELSCMIRRDRNHPSVILWSIGNEEHGEQGNEVGARVGLAMRRCARKLDRTRPITAAIDEPKAWGRGVTEALDVLGANYRTDQLASFHATRPLFPLTGTEIASSIDTRGIYVSDPATGYSVAYDTEFPYWGNTQEDAWSIVAAAPFIAGGFVWSGFDYRGEPAPKTRYPHNSSQYGLMDTCGFPKDNYFYYRAWWRDEPSLHLFPHWNWQAGQTVKVWCHTNLERVELFLNGASLGLREIKPYRHLEWDVPYAPGTLEARGYRGGRVVLTARRETTSEPASLGLYPDRAAIAADGEDVVVIRAEIRDAQGRVVPTANNRVTFDLSGPAAIVGVGNGDPRCVEPDKASARSAFNGLCLVVLKASKTPGALVLRATSPGLGTATLTLSATPATPRPFVS
jgi:beta-galactosidase